MQDSGKNKGGRPRAWKPTDLDFEHIREYAKRGMTEKQIAYELGRSYKSWQLAKEKYPKIDEAVIEGQLIGRRIITSMLWHHIEDKNSRHHFAAIKYYGDNVIGYGTRARMAEAVKQRLEDGVGAAPAYDGVDYQIESKKHSVPEVAEVKDDGTPKAP